MPPLVCGPAFYLLRAITALEIAITSIRLPFSDYRNLTREGLLSNSGQY